MVLIPECPARNNPWTLPGVDQKQNKTKTKETNITSIMKSDLNRK